MGRAPCCDKSNVKRGPWSPEEDDKLKSYIEKHGTGGNWIALPPKTGLKRCGKSCRLRWLNYLRPNIKHGGFTEDEDNLICSLYITIGSRWSVIAGQLPGRTDNDIKNYWNTRLKKKLIGKQRRDQKARRQICNSQAKTQVDHNYLTNEFLSLYNQLQLHQQAPPPIEMHAIEAPFSCNTLQTTNTTPDFQYTCDELIGVQDQHTYADSVKISSASTSLPQDQMDGFNNLFDISYRAHPPTLSNYQVCQNKTLQNLDFFDQPRLLGHSE